MSNNFQEIFAQSNWQSVIHNFSPSPDDVIIRQFFNSLETGRFLEIGSNDGVDGHTRFLLEQGWHAVYCEPDPYACSRLIANTESFNDRVTIVNSVIAPTSGPLNFYLAMNGDNMSSTKSEWLDNQFIPEHNKITNMATRNPSGIRQVITNAMSFLDLINIVGSDFDLIVTDMEGADAATIQSINWEQFTKTKLIVTEAGASVAKHLYTSGGFMPLCLTNHNGFYYR